MEVPLRLKYRRLGRGHKQQKGGHNNQGTSLGKHVAHPLVFAFKRNGYKCEPKWNPKDVAA